MRKNLLKIKNFTESSVSAHFSRKTVDFVENVMAPVIELVCVTCSQWNRCASELIPSMLYNTIPCHFCDLM